MARVIRPIVAGSMRDGPTWVDVGDCQEATGFTCMDVCFGHAREPLDVSHSGPFYNRRIGSRIAFDGARLGWRPVLPRRLFHRAQRADSVTVADLSITGALVVGARDARVRVGTQVEIDVGGQRGIVEIRRIDADTDPALAWYGVQFVDLQPELQQLINDTVASRRPGDILWRWNSAH